MGHQRQGEHGHVEGNDGALCGPRCNCFADTDRALVLVPSALVLFFLEPLLVKTLILYNDSPAPVPGYDIRNDYYTGHPDQVPSGGAPPAVPLAER